MYCKKCGKRLADGDKFCSACGAKVEEPNLNKGLGLDGSDGEEKSKPSFHMTGLNWDLDGFPQKSKPSENVDFNWSSVMEERDRRRLEEKQEPQIMTEEDLFGKLRSDAAAPGKGSTDFNWDLGTTARIDRTRKIEPYIWNEDNGFKPEPLREAEAEAESGAKADGFTSEGQNEASREDVKLSKHRYDAEEAAAAMAEGIAAAQSAPKRSIDKFYTFNKKNEEFQQLLDQEYERLRKRIKEENEAEEILAAKQEKLDKAREAWDEEEIKEPETPLDEEAKEEASESDAPTEQAEENKETVTTDAVNEADEEHEEASEEVKAEAEEPAEESADKDEQKLEEEELAEAAENEGAAEAEEGEEENEEQTVQVEEDEAEADEDDVSDTSDADEPQNDAAACDADEAERDASAESCPPSGSEKDSSEEQYNGSDGTSSEEQEDGTAEPHAEQPSEKLEEKADEGEKPAQTDETSGGSDRPHYSDIFADDDDDDIPDRKKSGRAKLIALDIIIAILIIATICTGVMAFMPESALAAKMRRGFSQITSTMGLWDDNKKENVTPEDSTAGNDDQKTASESTTAAQAIKALSVTEADNIASITADSSLKFKDTYGVSASEFMDSDWTADASAKKTSEKIVSTLIGYYSAYWERMNTGSDAVLAMIDSSSDLYKQAEAVTAGSDTHSISKLEFGDIVSGGDTYYSLIRVTDSVAGTETTSIYVVALNGEMAVTSVTDVTSR